jgi:hypothetical protein
MASGASGTWTFEAQALVGSDWPWRFEGKLIGDTAERFLGVKIIAQVPSSRQADGESRDQALKTFQLALIDLGRQAAQGELSIRTGS